MLFLKTKIVVQTVDEGNKLKNEIRKFNGISNSTLFALLRNRDKMRRIMKIINSNLIMYV